MDYMGVYAKNSDEINEKMGSMSGMFLKDIEELEKVALNVEKNHVEG